MLKAEWFVWKENLLVTTTKIVGVGVFFVFHDGFLDRLVVLV